MLLNVIESAPGTFTFVSAKDSSGKLTLFWRLSIGGHIYGRPMGEAADLIEVDEFHVQLTKALDGETEYNISMHKLFELCCAVDLFNFMGGRPLGPIAVFRRAE